VRDHPPHARLPEDVPIIMLTAMTERRFPARRLCTGRRRLHHQAVRLDDLRAKLTKERWQRRRRNHLKASRASYGAGPAQGGREVINALEDAVLLPSVDRCIRRDAFQNYLLQTKDRPGNALSIRAIKVAAIHDIFTRLSGAEYQTTHGRYRHLRVAPDAIHRRRDHTSGQRHSPVGLRGASSLTKGALHDALQAAGSPGPSCGA
jgi:hypothetical protein